MQTHHPNTHMSAHARARTHTHTHKHTHTHTHIGGTRDTSTGAESVDRAVIHIVAGFVTHTHKHTHTHTHMHMHMHMYARTQHKYACRSINAQIQDICTL